MTTIDLTVPESRLKEAGRHLRFSCAPFLLGAGPDPDLAGHTAIRIQVGQNLVLGRQDPFRLVQVSVAPLSPPRERAVAWVPAEPLLGYLSKLPDRKPKGSGDAGVVIRIAEGTLHLSAGPDHELALPLYWVADEVWELSTRLFLQSGETQPQYTAALDPRALAALRRIAKGSNVLISGNGGAICAREIQESGEPGEILTESDGKPLVLGKGVLDARVSSDLLEPLTRFRTEFAAYTTDAGVARMLVGAGGSARVLVLQAAQAPAADSGAASARGTAVEGAVW